MLSLELKVPPLAVWLIAAGAMFMMTRLVPGWSVSLPGRTALAVVLAGFGVAMTLSGVVAFRVRRTTVNPLTPGAASAMVTSGVYRISRNPMYVGFFLALVGWAVYLSHIGAALLLPVFVAYMTRYQIKPEERALLARFGAEYAEYQSQVRRWL